MSEAKEAATLKLILYDDATMASEFSGPMQSAAVMEYMCKKALSALDDEKFLAHARLSEEMNKLVRPANGMPKPRMVR